MKGVRDEIATVMRPRRREDLLCPHSQSTDEAIPPTANDVPVEIV